MTADRKRPYPCNLCPSRFGSKMELEEHQNSHTGMKPFECDVSSALHIFKFNRLPSLTEVQFIVLIVHHLFRVIDYVRSFFFDSFSRSYHQCLKTMISGVQGSLQPTIDIVEPQKDPFGCEALCVYGVSDDVQVEEQSQMP